MKNIGYPTAAPAGHTILEPSKGYSHTVTGTTLERLFRIAFGNSGDTACLNTPGDYRISNSLGATT